jgi:hypothetical protein
MKRALLLSLLLAGCASYQPNVPAAQQAKPTYAEDVDACQSQAQQIAQRQFGAFGLASVLYNDATMSDAELKESRDALSADGKKKIINNCMTKKGYTVQP